MQGRPLRAFILLAISGAHAQEKQENYASWPPLQSTFESTGGNGIIIKGYARRLRTQQATDLRRRSLRLGSLYQLEAIVSAECCCALCATDRLLSAILVTRCILAR